MAAPAFTPKTLAFLRSLARHNDREWFRARKDEYERHVRAPMVAVIEQLASDFQTFAPELLADPRRSLYRIYRDTRFSEDKSPLKTHIAAVFPPRNGQRHGSAGLYLEVAPRWVWVGGGLYAPATADLYRLREHLCANLTRFRAIVESPGFRRTCDGVRGDRLQRVPRGFRKDHPAADYLRLKQFLAYREFAPEFATSPRFYRDMLKVFKAIAPLVRFLNEGLATGLETAATAQSSEKTRTTR